MPRALGQIDEAKREAILEAASIVFAEAGFNAPLEHVARAAGVSKQTLYNQFGGRDALIEALVDKRRQLITAALNAPQALDRLEDTLASFASALIRRHVDENSSRLMRVVVSAAGEHPALARLIFDVGPMAARLQLASFLQREHELGRLHIEDALAAAETFAGMAGGHLQLEGLLGLPRALTDDAIERRARECAMRFIRAYAPDNP